MGDFFNVKNDALPSSFVLREHYLIKEVIGHGGFGITYAAFDTSLQIDVAVKELFLRRICSRGPGAVVTAPDQYRAQFDQNKKYFLEEARVLAQLGVLNLPGIVSVRDFFEENNTAYIVMELLSGMTLREYVRQKGGGIPGQQICMLLNDAVSALSVMHDRGIIHKDISPDNIMILPGGAARILDFGCAMRLSKEVKPAQLSYRRGYAAPEQYSFDGTPGKSTDVYSLGATVYFCLTGRNPVDAPGRLQGRRLTAPGELGAFAGVVSERVLYKAMELSPDKRYPDVREFWEEYRESVFVRRTAGGRKRDRRRRAGPKESASGRKGRPGNFRAALCISVFVSAVAGFFVLGFPSIPVQTKGESLISGPWTGRQEDEVSGSRLPEAGTQGALPEIITIKEGLYQISSLAGKGLRLHIRDDSYQEGAFMDLRGAAGSSGVFLIKKQENGYSIRCTGNKNGRNYWISILDDSPESGAYLCQRREDGSARQYWTFWRDADDSVYIRSFAGTWMDAEQASKEDGESVRLRDFNRSVYQKWRLEKLPEDGK